MLSTGTGTVLGLFLKITGTVPYLNTYIECLILTKKLKLPLSIGTEKLFKENRLVFRTIWLGIKKLLVPEQMRIKCRSKKNSFISRCLSAVKA
jgi:hypothetical protein